MYIYYIGDNPNHRWLYFPDMTKDELLILKQWDSHGTLARKYNAHTGHVLGEDPTAAFMSTLCVHSAFVDNTTPDNYPKRESIECRMLVLLNE